MNGEVYFYQGRKGSGKTLTMVKDALNFHHEGWRVYSNFAIPFGERITNEEFLNFDKNNSLSNCVILIDEIQSLLDNRRSMSKTNLKSTHFMQQIRKKNIKLLATAQFRNTVDLRFKQHVDIEIYPKYHKLKSGDVCEVTYIDRTAIIDDNNINTDFGIDTAKSVQIVFDPKPIFALYDTMEMIT